MDRRQALSRLTAAVALGSCSRSDRATIGSKNFTEQVILGEIVALYLEQRLGLPVDRKLDLGGTLLAHQSIVNGSIDVYPEYTGTALTAVLGLPPLQPAEKVFERVKSEYERRFSLTWLPPLGFDNSFAMVIRGELARRHGLSTLSEAAAFRPGWKLGVGYEFLDRPDGLEALKRTYGLPLAGAPITMDLGLLYRALEQDQVTMVAGSATDGLLSVLDVVVLRDDKQAFPPYQGALVVRPERTRMVEALGELSGKLSVKTMRALNHSVDGKHQIPRDVASSFVRGLPAS